MSNSKRSKIIKNIALGLGCCLLVGFTPNWEDQIKQLDKLQVLGESQGRRISDVRTAPELARYVDQPALTARAALAYDFSSGSILYTHNFDQKLPIASLTKLLSALVVVNSGHLDDVVEVKAEDIRVIGPNTGLVAGEKITAYDLTKAMLISSHNDSSRTLARHVGGTVENFVVMMNNQAKEYGMFYSNFTNPIGFDDPNHYSTAQDLTILIKKFMEEPRISVLVSKPEDEIKALNMPITHKVNTTNKLLLENPTVVGIKTGYTTEAKGNLAIRSIDDKSDVVTIVLGSDDREEDTRKVLEWVRSVYRW